MTEKEELIEVSVFVERFNSFLRYCQNHNLEVEITLESDGHDVEIDLSPVKKVKATTVKKILV